MFGNPGMLVKQKELLEKAKERVHDEGFVYKGKAGVCI